MGRDYAPRTLDHELHEERTEDEQRLVGSIGPERNDRGAENERGDDGAAAAFHVREIPEGESSHDGADSGDRGDCRAARWGHVPLPLQKGGIHVLRSMRREHHGGHKGQQVEKELPVREDLAVLLTPAQLCFGPLLPDSGFLHAEEYVEDEGYGGQTAENEE